MSEIESDYGHDGHTRSRSRSPKGKMNEATKKPKSQRISARRKAIDIAVNVKTVNDLKAKLMKESEMEKIKASNMEVDNLVNVQNVKVATPVLLPEVDVSESQQNKNSDNENEIPKRKRVKKDGIVEKVNDS